MPSVLMERQTGLSDILSVLSIRHVSVTQWSLSWREPWTEKAFRILKILPHAQTRQRKLKLQKIYMEQKADEEREKNQFG